ncbi:MAG: tyrosine-type recombinase/integrase [Dehalococcoidia bacterium]
MTLKNLTRYPLNSQGIARYLGELKCSNGRRNYYVGVRAFCNWLYERGYIDSNPIRDVPVPKTRKRMLSAPSERQVEEIIEAAETITEKCLVSLAFSSGLRLSELARVDVRDVDMDSMTVRVVVKGNRETRAVFDERTAEYLNAQINGRVHGSVFGLKPRGIQDLMSRLSAKTGIQFSCHSFRRAFASNLRRKGLDISHIMVLGNWSGLEMVMKYSESVGFEESMRLYREVSGD